MSSDADLVTEIEGLGEKLAAARESIARRFIGQDRVVDLTAREYALLEYLALRRGELVSRTEIWDHIYEYHSSATSNVVDVYVRYLRNKLNAEGQANLIQTRRGFGYVLETSAR